MTADEVFDRLCAGVDALLSHLPVASVPGGSVSAAVRHQVAERAWDDLCALADRDAAAGGDPRYVFDSYVTFRAVLAYRVAHEMLRLPGPPGLMRTAARRLSEQAKVSTGVEIHPAATIGRRFVIDHGFGTVIGEQTRIGDDCYLLQGVVLGGPSIGYSSTCGPPRRHPQIGDRVEIGGGAAVFGPVTIGNDCRLEPGVRVTFDVPDGTRVRLVATTQVCLSPRHVEVHSVSVTAGGLLVTGAGLANLRPALLNEDRTMAFYLPVTQADDSSISCGRPPVPTTTETRFLGLFEEATLACYVGGGSVLRDL